MRNNIYGILGLEVKNANWNADFSGEARTDSEGNFIASAFALQYCNKVEWKRRNESVLGLKSYNNENVRSMNECYINNFENDSDKKAKKTKRNRNDVIKNLFTFKDVKNYGVTFANENIGIRGLVQTSIGVNKFDGAEMDIVKNMSPFASGEGKSQSTLGEIKTLEEAHFIYEFTIMPSVYDEYNGIIDSYTEKDYEDFKDVSLVSVTNYNSKAKKGCRNEFGLFIKTKEESQNVLNLAGLNDYIKVYNKDKVIYDLTLLKQLVQDINDKIESIEMYYNVYTMQIEGWDMALSKNYNIVNRGEIV